MVRPDYRKSLEQLRDEWKDCQDCELGKRRAAVDGNFVAGEGEVNKPIMFIGEGPGKTEEKEGRPFVGKSGKILRAVIAKLKLPAYMSNIVACRSCSQMYDNEGKPRYQKEWGTGNLIPRIQDSPPTPSQIAACLPRLYEEVYLVDPLLIVALGAEAAKTLGRSAVSILAETGVVREIEIPGAGYRPSLTEKKKAWVRRVQGRVVLPVERNTVRYLMMPLLHPAYIARRYQDARHGNPVEMFVNGMRTVSNIHQWYTEKVLGTTVPPNELTDVDILQAIQEGEENNG